jgi:diphthamide biosynthesis protein 4
MTTPTSHYEILNLPHDAPLQTVRPAYHRALLLHHPDKTASLISQPPSKQPKYSIDQISSAFTILSDAKTRARYDADLSVDNGVKDPQGGFKTGVEVVDLDDLEGGDGAWWRGCRCGQERGYEVREGDLEAAIGEGEVLVGCKGCSLWLRVLFGVAEEGGEGEKG